MKKQKLRDCKPLKLDRTTLRPIDGDALDTIVGGNAARIGITAFPCWTENNCPAPA